MPELLALELMDHERPGTVVTVRASLRALQLKRNMAGELWASMLLEQSGTTMTVLVFTRTFAGIRDGVLQPDTLLQFDARITRGSDGRTLLSPVTTPALAP